MSAFGKPNATGRSSGVHSGRERKLRSPPDQSWSFLTTEMMESPAWRALSVNARKVVDRLIVEHAHHSGRENGHLIVTHDQFKEYGVTRRLIPEAIRESVYMGFVRIEQKGGMSYGGHKHPSRYRLTFYVTKDLAPATNEWKGVAEDKITEWRSGRQRMRRAGVSPGAAVSGS